MKDLQNKAATMLASGEVALVIGYQKDLQQRVVPLFATASSELEALIYSPECRNNLSVYLNKPEVRKVGNVLLVANPSTLRSILQLYAENQLSGLQLKVLVSDENNEWQLLTTPQEIESVVQSRKPVVPQPVLDELERLRKLSREERWAFWKDQLSLCVKCYACRAVCPMCYCSQCTVECNQPQWIRTSSEPSANFEWHTMRAMHLAGRCIECGECYRACPAGIPIHLLTLQMNQQIEEEFGARSGTSLQAGYALNSFKPGDKEHFIK